MPWTLQQRTTSGKSTHPNGPNNTDHNLETDAFVAIEHSSSNYEDMGHEPETMSNEHAALIGFANRLGSHVGNSEPGIDDQSDVHKEARLLMSLSCPGFETTSSTVATAPSRFPSYVTKPNNKHNTKAASAAPHRNSFAFSCPSLSLETGGMAAEDEEDEDVVASELLGRALQVDDRDALRLSSDAMTRNLMISYQKAIEWRIHSWMHAVASSLATKEQNLKQLGCHHQLDALTRSAEAKLFLALRHIASTIKVEDISTTFRVLAQTSREEITPSPPPLKKRRTNHKQRQTLYSVTHVASMEGTVSVHTPYGNVQIDLQVPGFIKGDFSVTGSGLGSEELVGVSVDLNSDMLAAMMEKSGRLIVRSTVETILRSLPAEKEEAVGKASAVAVAAATVDTTPFHRRLAQRKNSGEHSIGVSIITPRDTSSPSSYGDSDAEDRPLPPSIPEDFEQARSRLRMTSPQPSYIYENPFSMTTSSPSAVPIVSPQTSDASPFQRVKSGKNGNGPHLPVLVEVACAAMEAR